MSEYVVDVPDGMSIAHASDGTYPTCCRELTMCCEVVRCRDCAHMHESPLLDLPLCLFLGALIPDAGGFCAWGERREDAQV